MITPRPLDSEGILQGGDDGVSSWIFFHFVAFHSKGWREIVKIILSRTIPKYKSTTK